MCWLSNDICVSCLRTRHEVTTWRNMEMTDRMQIMKQLEGSKFTHNCPECDTPTYCAMENGTSGCNVYL